MIVGGVAAELWPGAENSEFPMWELGTQPLEQSLLSPMVYIRGSCSQELKLGAQLKHSDTGCGDLNSHAK